MNLAVIYTFKLNNIRLFDHLLAKYNSKYNKKHYKLFEVIDQHVELIFEGDNVLMLEKYMALMKEETDEDTHLPCYAYLYQQAIEHNRLGCLKTILRVFKPTLETLVNDIDTIFTDGNLELFQAIYDASKELFTHSVLQEILELIAPDNIDAFLCISKVDGFFDAINKDTNIFLVLMLDLEIDQETRTELLETFGNPRYITLEMLTQMEKNIDDNIYWFAQDVSNDTHIEIAEEASVKLDILQRIKENY